MREAAVRASDTGPSALRRLAFAGPVLQYVRLAQTYDTAVSTPTYRQRNSAPDAYC
jgi:hypothetical protein